MGDTIGKFKLSARMSGGKEGFRGRVRKRSMEFVGEWRTILSEKPMGPCNVNKVNNDQAALQCITTGEK